MMRRDLVGHLMKSGCRLQSESAGHSWWNGPVAADRSTVPRHADIADALAKKICHDLGISPPP